MEVGLGHLRASTSVSTAPACSAGGAEPLTSDGSTGTETSGFVVQGPACAFGDSGLSVGVLARARGTSSGRVLRRTRRRSFKSKVVGSSRSTTQPRVDLPSRSLYHPMRRSLLFSLTLSCSSQKEKSTVEEKLCFGSQCLDTGSEI